MSVNRRSFLLLCATLPAPAFAQEQAEYGGAFILVDHRGSTVMDEAFRGKYMLVAFGYTHCPDVCPTLLADMAHVLAELGPEGATIQPLFITLDPSRDTPAVLADYVSSFSTRITGLTGPEELIADVARKYRIKVRKQPGVGDSYSIDHTGAIFLMGRDGRFLERFNSAVKPDEMVARIRTRLRAD
jgi:cytochrome oxidase Cu insertion factor (SCO1/SenC/PrrC family)